MKIVFDIPVEFSAGGECGGCASHSCGGGR